MGIEYEAVSLSQTASLSADKAECPLSHDERQVSWYGWANELPHLRSLKETTANWVGKIDPMRTSLAAVMKLH